MKLIESNISNKKTPPKVFVGLSGGVDSSVSAALLKKQGYDVTGVYIKTWQPDWLPCTWRNERRDAMRVAARLGIPFLTFDFEKEYKDRVADYMIEEYRRGRTPNPDVMCNKEIKFGSFLRQSLAMGAQYIATGHYAQNIGGELYEGADKEKDQSYFLWTLEKDIFQKVLFPVGHLKKTKVRALARRFGLPTAAKKDSQGICFLGEVDMKDFLKHYIQNKPGEVIDEYGQDIGHHDGAWFYTIGERHGFTINTKTDHDKPRYVVAKDIEKNTLTVATREINQPSEFAVSNVTLENVLLRDDKKVTMKVGARIRYRQKKQTGTLHTQAENYTYTFDIPQDGVSCGQSLVLYDGEKCIGGGVISKLSV